MCVAQASLCGSAAGGFSAAVTTPLDVVKTRLMLGADAEGVKYKGTMDAIRRINAEGGAGRFFAGVGPRTMWISIGGCVFFGAYEGYFRVCFGASSSSLADVNPVHFVLGGGLAGLVA